MIFHRSQKTSLLLARNLPTGPGSGTELHTKRGFLFCGEGVLMGKGKAGGGPGPARAARPGGGSPTSSVKMTVTLPRSVAAFLRWKAEVDGIRRDELLRQIVAGYADKLREKDANIPPIDE